MDEVITVSRSDLIKAFQRWNTDYLKASPDEQAKHGEITEKPITATRQADHLIWLIKHQ